MVNLFSSCTAHDHASDNSDDCSDELEIVDGTRCNHGCSRKLLLKTALYRLFGFIITLIVSYWFTKEWFIASGIGITDLVVKTINYYIYEAVWECIQWGKIDKYRDTTARSWTKALVLRVEATTLTLIIAYIFTQELAFAGWLAALDVIQKLILYYLFEKLWIKLQILFTSVTITHGDSIGEMRYHCFGFCQRQTVLPV